MFRCRAVSFFGVGNAYIKSFCSTFSWCSYLGNKFATVYQCALHMWYACMYAADFVSVYIFVSLEFGIHVGTLVDNGTHVFMQVSVGRHHTTYYSTINKTSMLFLSISFIVLMIISLAWLVFYYVQRSRYTYAKQRLSVIDFTG